jgi:hypothetical protein
MLWQDLVLSAGSWLFIIALIPSILGKHKPPVSTSILTGSVLAAFSLTYATLELWLSVASTALLSLAWFILAAQKARKKK